MIVFGHSEEEHLEHLCIMFEHFREFNLKFKPSKCSFFQLEIIYLAHHVSCGGICPSRENVHVIEEFLMLDTFTQVLAFCGLAVHYQCFIKGFAHIARPLTRRGWVLCCPKNRMMGITMSSLLEVAPYHQQKGTGTALS